MVKFVMPEVMVSTTSEGSVDEVYGFVGGRGGGRGTAYAIVGQKGRECTRGHSKEAGRCVMRWSAWEVGLCLPDLVTNMIGLDDASCPS